MTALLADERQRLQALERYDILDTSQEEAFDRITRLVQRVFRVPIATVTFLDAHRQWFKSGIGLAVSETERSPALCDHAVRSGQTLVVADTLEDDRFRENPFVTGAPEIRFYAGVPLVTPDGHAIGTLCAMDTAPRAFSTDETATLQDLARITMSELELRRLATTDGLTGALTRRGFRDEAMKAVSLALRHQHDLACVMLDLDHFKDLNDRYGHPVGDRVLAKTVEACRAHLRITDIIGRVGGEEFCIILPHTPRRPSTDVAEKLRAAIAAQRFEAPSGAFSVTASLGVASLDRQMGGLDPLLEYADKALYEAKNGGRNRCVAWSQPEPEKATIRRRVLKAGRIAFNGRRSSIDCTVRSLSDKEARLDVFTSAGLPVAFELVIEADHFVKSCRVVGQSEKHLDVAFD